MEILREVKLLPDFFKVGMNMEEPCRITIYCNSETQREKILNFLRNEKYKHGFKKIGDALEKIIEERTE